MPEECAELQNIKYQTMLLNNNSTVMSNRTDTEQLGDYLKKESEENKKKSWSKLGKASKMKKLSIFIHHYITKHNLSKRDKQELRRYLLICLERKKLHRVKDVIYDMEQGTIKSIPGLSFDKIKQKFTLKRVDKKKSTLRDLAPKRKTRGKKKDKIDIYLKSTK